MPMVFCDCGSGDAFDQCCGPFLSGIKTAPDPERLMRSRYTAFCRRDAAYLTATLDLESQTNDVEQTRRELARTMATTDWLGLMVIRTGLDGPDRGWVEFAAFFSQVGEQGQLHEKSAFVRRDGRWLYRDGQFLPPVSPGRNQPCFCGSGKKYKHCHGRAD